MAGWHRWTEATVDKEGRKQTDQLELGKKLSLFDFFAIGFGAIIGVGWVISVGDWINLGGGPLSVILAFAAGALMLLPIGKVYGNLSSQYAKAGGALVYARMAFGKRFGFLTGWFLALGYIMLCPWEVIAIGQIAETLFPALRTIPLYMIGDYTIFLPTLIVNLIIAGLIIVSNFTGIEKVAKVQRVLVIGLMAVGAIAIITALGLGKATAEIFNVAATPRNMNGSLAAGFIAVLTITPFYFAGFDTIPQEAEEYKVPGDKKGICRMVVLSICAALVFYTLIIVGISGSMPWTEVIKYNLPAAAAYEYGLGLPIVAKIIIIGGLCGLISTLNSFFVAGARVLFALGREGMVTRKLAAIHPKYHTPYIANAVVAIVAIAGSFLGKSYLLPITNVCSFCFVLAWMMASLASWKLRGQDEASEAGRPKKIWYIAAIASCVLLLLLLILPWSSGALAWPLEWAIIMGWLACGIFLYILRSKKENDGRI